MLVSFFNIMKKVALLLLVIGIIPSCIQGRRVKDVDFPATPINLAKITKVGKACFSINAFATRGSGSIAFSSSVGFPCDYVVYSGGSVRQAQNTSPGLNGSFVIAYYTN